MRWELRRESCAQHCNATAKRTCEVGWRRCSLLGRDMPHWKRHGDASSLWTWNVRATCRATFSRFGLLPWRPPVTFEPPDDRFAGRRTPTGGRVGAGGKCSQRQGRHGQGQWHAARVVTETVNVWLVRQRGSVTSMLRLGQGNVSLRPPLTSR